MNASEIMACLEHTEERAYQWEKRMRIEEEMEEKWQESERRHEERMHGMFRNILQQMMMMGGGWATAPFPPMPELFPAPTEDPNTPLTSESDNNPPSTSRK